MPQSIFDLLNMLVYKGGKIVSSNSLQPDAIEQARRENRMYVDDNHLGYVWMPEVLEKN